MTPDPWVAARKRHHLSHAQVQMARELGMNPHKLGKIDNHKQAKWKLPLPLFIEHLYEKRFGRSFEEQDEQQLQWEVGGEEIDDRPESLELFLNLEQSLPALKKLLDETGRAEDSISPLYHQSISVYGLQEQTLRIVAALQALAPERRLNPWFTQIVSEGTGREFDEEDDRYWLEITRPMVEAFLHARFFLEIAVRHGKSLRQPPDFPSRGWAALLSLYAWR